MHQHALLPPVGTQGSTPAMTHPPSHHSAVKCQQSQIPQSQPVFSIRPRSASVHQTQNFQHEAVRGGQSGLSGGGHGPQDSDKQTLKLNDGPVFFIEVGVSGIHVNPLTLEMSPKQHTLFDVPLL